MGGQNAELAGDGAVVEDERGDRLGVVRQFDHLGGPCVGVFGLLGLRAAGFRAECVVFSVAARDPVLGFAILARLGDLSWRDLELGGPFVIRLGH